MLIIGEKTSVSEESGVLRSGMRWIESEDEGVGGYGLVRFSSARFVNSWA